MIGRPRRSPLFPYPTLFRSLDSKPIRFSLSILLVLGSLLAGWPAAIGPVHADAFSILEQLLPTPASRPYDIVTGPMAAGQPARDRKSTRLNSSHSPISYAGL